MIAWKNLDTLEAYRTMAAKAEKVDLPEVMSGENGAARAKAYSVPMAAGLTYNYAAKQVNNDILKKLAALAGKPS